MKTNSTLSITLTTLSIVVLVLTALTFMDNNTTRNTYAGIILLSCLFVFAISVSVRQPSGKSKTNLLKS